MTVRRLVVAGQLVDETPTGAQVHLREIVRAMIVEQPDLSVIARHTTSRGGRPNRESAARISAAVRPVTTPVPATALHWAQRRLRFPAERALLGRYDVYHQFHADCDPAVPGRRLVVTLHDTVGLVWPEAEGRMFAGAPRLLGRAAAVITVSEFAKSAIVTAFDLDPARVHVIANGVDHARFRPSPPPSPDVPSGPYLLFTGGHTPRKNVERTIAAFARVRADRPDLRLVLAGPVVHREADLRACAPADLPPDALLFPGYLPDDVLPALYAGAGALVYPSLYEGFGMPIVEAMACGTPVVTSDEGAMRDVAGGSAVLVDPSDVAAIAGGITRVLTESSAERTVRRAAGLSRAAEFTWARAGRGVLDVYDAIART